VLFGATQRHSANSQRHFSMGRSDLLTARFRVRIPCPGAKSEFGVKSPRPPADWLVQQECSNLKMLVVATAAVRFWC
jgi:hypothetical protein